MSRKTSHDELYSTIASVITELTDRVVWNKTKIQARPTAPFALVFLVQGAGYESPTVSTVGEIGLDGTTMKQTVWGACRIDVLVEFYKSSSGNSALDAANRLRNGLYLEKRFDDIWEICGLVGAVRIIDVSALFRADVEPRANVNFSIIANISDPLPMTGDEIMDIETESIEITEVLQDSSEITETVIVINEDNS